MFTFLFLITSCVVIFNVFTSFYYGIIFWKNLYEDCSSPSSKKEKDLINILFHPFHLWMIFTQAMSSYSLNPQEIQLRASILLVLTNSLPNPIPVSMIRALLRSELRSLLLAKRLIDSMIQKGLLGNTSVALIEKHLLGDDNLMNSYKKFIKPASVETQRLLKALDYLEWIDNEEMLKTYIEGRDDQTPDVHPSSLRASVPVFEQASPLKDLVQKQPVDFLRASISDKRTSRDIFEGQRFIGIGKHHHDQHSFVFAGMLNKENKPEVHYKFGKQRYLGLWGSLRREESSMKRDITYAAYEINLSEYRRFMSMIVWMAPSLEIHFSKDRAASECNFKKISFNQIELAMIERSYHLTPWNNCRTTAIDIICYSINTSQLNGGVSNAFYDGFPSYARFRKDTEKEGITHDPFYLYPMPPDCLVFHKASKELKNQLEFLFKKMEDTLRKTTGNKTKEFSEFKLIYKEAQKKILLLSQDLSTEEKPLVPSKGASGFI